VEINRHKPVSLIAKREVLSIFALDSQNLRFKVYTLKIMFIIKMIMNKLSFLTILFLLPFLFVILVQSDSCRGNRMDNLSAKKDDVVITGEWGGEHIGVQINEDTAEIDFDCANGKINQRISLDKDGKFDLIGTYTIEHSGPTRDDKPPPTYSAKYAGIVKDKTMTLTVTLIDTKKDIGTFTLTHGSRSRVMKCR
jgi:hypothetical protein